MIETVTRDEKATELRSMLRELGERWPIVPGLLRTEIVSAHDIHAYYYLTGVSKAVLHIQAYPGLSTEREAVTFARLMDGEKLVKARAAGINIGNEHVAVIGTVYDQTKTEYYVDELIGLVGKNLRKWRIPQTGNETSPIF